MNLDWLAPEMKALVEKVTEPQRVAATLWGEARSEPIQGIVAVAHVIRNRVQKPGWWGKDFSSVCLSPNQFSCWTRAGGDKNYERLLSLMRQFADGKAIEEAGARECIGVAHLIIGNYLRDNTKSSCHYHTATLTPRPKWAKGHAPVIQVGRHVFYSDIP